MSEAVASIMGDQEDRLIAVCGECGNKTFVVELDSSDGIFVLECACCQDRTPLFDGDEDDAN